MSRYSHLSLIEIQHLRNVQYGLLDLVPSVNMLWGHNGAGKTSICEALSLLFHGRSFRASTTLSSLISRGEKSVQIKARLIDDDQQPTKIAMLKSREQPWVVNRDGAQQGRLQDITRLLPLMVLSPEFDNFLDVPPARRRHHMDWLLFHVEHQYGDDLKAYNQCLVQRNKLLRVKGRVDDELHAWTHALAEHGQRLSDKRQRVIGLVNQYLQKSLAGGQFEGCEVRLAQGWVGQSFKSALEGVQYMELRRKVTLLGPHRADLPLFDASGEPLRPYLSRGEKKRLGLHVILALVSCLHLESRQRSLLVVDDWRAELDDASRSHILRYVSHLGLQVLVTTTEQGDERYLSGDARMFHVEHGRIECVGENAL